MRVLIAEDSAIERLVLRSVVESLGRECLIATDGAEAWTLFGGAEVNVVISDWVMPGLEGNELCPRVRAQSGRSYKYFILLTALEDKQPALMAMQAGADDYLGKPLRLISATRITALHQQLAAAATELQRWAQELYTSARIDPLTGLGNRRRLQEDPQALHGRAQRYGHEYCAALCDLDHFKACNDRYGHLVGDEALARVAQRPQRLSLWRRGAAPPLAGTDAREGRHHGRACT